ncbi:GNAT family N-acetyltransferase [Streptomyces sp. NPDC049906]|uniref:GNAT family N-acetyltransferase n=1 Tax=Streptomyces sp. NPDC049906 TaxID=3155656 RepID=UPI00341727A6
MSAFPTFDESSFTIRPVRPTELPALQEIERAAGRPFAEVGMPEVAEDDPPALDDLARHAARGTCWVAVARGTGDPVAYLIAEPVDGRLFHVEQVSVHPRAARRGVGRALIDHAAARAAVSGAVTLTLTTFAEVPWNAPYYARIGFRVLAEHELTSGLREIRAHETAQGLDRWPRVVMARPVAVGSDRPQMPKGSA